MLDRLAISAPKFIHRCFWYLLCLFLSKRNPRLKYKLKEIEGKTLFFDITGVTYCYALSVKGGMLKPLKLNDGTEPDVILRAKPSLFFNLVANRIDFDQAFFSRKLKIEKDLETALYLKNVLNG